MRALLQRVNHASVRVNGEVVGQIKQGILVFLGIGKNDNQDIADRMLHKLIHYRLFNDADGRMNCNVQQVNGGLLLVSQFTLAADTERGLRPGFSTAMPPDQAEPLYDYMVRQAQQGAVETASGVFGADMKISLENDGPVTFLLTVS